MFSSFMIPILSTNIVVQNLEREVPLYLSDTTATVLGLFSHYGNQRNDRGINTAGHASCRWVPREHAASVTRTAIIAALVPTDPRHVARLPRPSVCLANLI